jgi:predicted O-linked N-acetylglucosamine transferase (SPINDLY family)
MIAMNPQLQLMLQQGIQAFQDGNVDSADSILKRVIQVDAKNLPALHILGLVKASQEKFEEAANLLARAARIEPNDASIRYNLAKALADSGSDREAIPHHKKSIELDPNNPQAWLNYGRTSTKLGRHDDALTYYDKALGLQPDYAEAVLNKGAALKELKRYEEAIVCAEQALTINFNLAEGWLNLGAALKELKLYDKAITHFDKALSLQPDYAEAWGNKGLSLHELKRYDEAIVHIEKALSLKSDIDWLYGQLLSTKMKICSWADLMDSVEIISKRVLVNERVVQPFTLLELNDEALLHKKSSEIYVQHRYPLNTTLGPIFKHPQGQKIRIAYFSGDFKNHPVAYLTAELFEIHDRSRFETYAFSLMTASDGMRDRIHNGFDHFIDTEKMSDLEIAQHARELRIDIAIDLSGFTEGARTGIFSYRAAPIQVNWLGYPGTSGADFIDYIVADKTIIPESHQRFYTEKVVYLPDTYMVDDSMRIPSPRIFIREECGLPKNDFVFCCFNNSHKFNPQVLDSWSRILLKVENSVLWIPENNQYFMSNVVIEFEKRGIHSKRIIFAKRIELMADHLARSSLADIFLDTYPYNAHTTTMDSLKAGVPVLTLMGESFTSRVAASLLNAIGLPELITTTQSEYEDTAIELAMNPQKLASIKQKLASNRLTAPLFNTPRFTKNLEAAYIKMYERYQSGSEPEPLFIEASIL